MSDAAVPMADATEPSGLSQIERVVDTYIAPSKTFTDIRRSASWWLPFLLVLAFFFLFNSISASRVGTQRLAEMRLTPDKGFQNLPPDQQAQRLSLTAKYWVAFGDGFGSVAILVVGLIAAGLIFLVINFGLGGQATYKQYLAVWFYSGLPVVLSFLLIIVTLFVGNPEDFNINNPAATNPAFFLSSDSPHWLLVLLQQFDLFTIWAIILTIIGVSIVAKVKRSTAAMGIVGMWVAWIVIRVAAAAI